MDIPVSVHYNADNSSSPHHEPESRTHGGRSRTGMAIVVVLVVAAGIWLAQRNQGLESPFGKNTGAKPQATELAMAMEGTAPVQDSAAVAVQTSWIPNFADIEFPRTGALSDVAGGTASGSVGVDVITGVYHLYATFANLPEPAEGFFYEGWVVRTNPMSAVSTGALVKPAGKYVNAYLSRTDLSDHASYVVTLEPNDNDPAPGEHILEGAIAAK